MDDYETVLERGIIAHWNDAKGFGFVKPMDGVSPNVFLHISDIRKGLVRKPAPGDVAYYRLGKDTRTCKPRAYSVVLVELEEKKSLCCTPVRWRGPWIICGLFVAAPTAFSAYWWLVTGNRYPMFVYAVASIATFFMYRSDKRAAQLHDWRIPEARLHLAELLGGWPGALFAQCWFSHKNSKRSYQVIFWFIVGLHFAAWGEELVWHGEIRKAVWRQVTGL